MCSYIVMKAALVDSSAKGAKGWMRVDTANVYYDHPYHAPLDHALGIALIAAPLRKRDDFRRVCRIVKPHPAQTFLVDVLLDHGRLVVLPVA
jgi:hypothetical protein